MDKAVEIDRNFTYHAPTEESVRKLQDIRNLAKQFAFLINDLTPDSREKSLAISNLEQAVMWANAGVVRNQVTCAEGWDV